ncbi:MAG: LytTR family DNA-binding domain-containing protein [Gemmatimonadota bacterium]
MSDGGHATISAIIVDDEPLARDCVRIALEDHPEVRIVAECGDGERAVEAIRQLDPDLVFLDVQMPGMDGFDVIEVIGVERMPVVVFVTAYDQHALKAFEIHAADYVLKPFDDARFMASVGHAIQRVRQADVAALSRTLNGVLRELPGPLRDDAGDARWASRIMVRDRDRIRFVPVDEIDWLEGAGNYVRVHAGKASHLIRATLAGLGDRLDPTRFIRIHRSTIVNVDRIREVQPWAGGDYVAILHDGESLKVSRSYRDDLLKPLS